VIVAQDITEIREADARRDLMLREVEHRAKNTLAVVQAALRLGASGTTDARELAKAVEARVTALARSQSLLTIVGEQGASLHAIVEQEVAPFAVGKERVTIEGPDIRVTASAAQALTMAIHEVATNAAKYGALSSQHGIVMVHWSVDVGKGCLILEWDEQGARVSAAPRRTGFGTRLMDVTITHQLGGQVQRRWSPEGLNLTAEIPSIMCSPMMDSFLSVHEEFRGRLSPPQFTDSTDRHLRVCCGGGRHALQGPGLTGKGALVVMFFHGFNAFLRLPPFYNSDAKLTSVPIPGPAAFLAFSHSSQRERRQAVGAASRAKL
jgi:two-component sensor histidine kinase